MPDQSEIDRLEKILNSEDPTPVRITLDGKVVPISPDPDPDADEMEKILSTPDDVILAAVEMRKKILLAVRDGVFHDEQIGVWVEEITAGLSPFLSIETYDDGIEAHEQIAAVISGSIRERVCDAITESN